MVKDLHPWMKKSDKDRLHMFYETLDVKRIHKYEERCITIYKRDTYLHRSELFG